MELRLCIFERRRRSGVTFLHICASRTVCSYVYAYLSASSDLNARLCMFERRRRYGVTFLHIAAPATIWSYVSAYRSAGGDLDLRFCILERLRRRSRRVYDARPAFGFRVRLPRNELRNFIKTNEFEIPPMECRARRSRAVFKISGLSHTPCGRPAVAAADLEGFAHSAAAEGKKRPQVCTHVYQLSAQGVRNDFTMFCVAL